MLYLAAERRNDALRPFPGLSPTREDFWKEQLYGLATYLDDSQPVDEGRRAGIARRHNSAAADELGELAPLEVRNLTFCQSISGFGMYEEIRDAAMTPSQRVLLYAEIENFRSDSSEEGFHTSLGSSYQILDEEGRRVARDEFPTVNDFCKTRRGDFHIQFQATLPERLYPGRYTLELTVEDKLARKIGQTTVSFEVK
jgi:hypothetical protein